MSRRVLQNNYKYLKANSEKDGSNGQRDWEFQREIDTLIKNQMEFLELKNTIELESPVDKFKWIFDTVQKRIGELKKRPEENIQTEAWR